MNDFATIKIILQYIGEGKYTHILFYLFCSKCPKLFSKDVGEFMVDHNKIRAQLMEGAIKAVSEYGLEGLTTRSIEQQCKVKDSYIYRYFEDKEDLLKKAFIREDKTLIAVIEHYFPIMQNDKLDFKERCYSLWKPCWQYLVSRPDVCRFYVRYYYSTYFKQQAFNEHLVICETLIDKVKNAFPNNVNAEMLLHHILETMLSYGMKVALGEMDNSEDDSNMAFNFCYSVVCAYISPNKNAESNEIKEKGKLSYLEFYSIVNTWK